MEIDQKLLNLKRSILKFQKEQDSALETDLIFPKGIDTLFKLLKFEKGPVLEELDLAVASWESKITKLDDYRDDPLLQIQQCINSFESAISLVNQKKAAFPKHTKDQGCNSKQDFDGAILKSMQTINKLYVFGTKHKERIDFYWPEEKDIWTFRDAMTARINAISWKRRSLGTRIGALQIHFSDGTSSPIFLAKNETEDNLTRTDIPSSRIHSIKALVCDQQDINQLHFIDEAGKEIASVEASIGGSME